MVVYLYKKGRQTMKNIITTIAMFILTIGAQAQTYTVKVDTIYTFKHDKSIETQKAFDSGMVKDFGVGVRNLKFEFDETNKVITTFENGLIMEISDIKEISNINGEKRYFTEVGGFVFYKDKNGDESLAGAYFDSKSPNIVNGFYSKIKKGDE